jgi:hypothetical protein
MLELICHRRLPEITAYGLGSGLLEGFFKLKSNFKGAS